jgi:hypothetical protein
VFVGRARHNRMLAVSSSRNRFAGFVVAESARSVVLIKGNKFSRSSDRGVVAAGHG